MALRAIVEPATTWMPDPPIYPSGQTAEKETDNAMTARQQRRREEHKARKEAYKAQKQAEKQPAEQVGQRQTEPAAAVAPPVCAEVPRALSNKQNAQHSTGPRTPEGKLASSRNSFKHGLYSKQLVIQGEDPAELDALRDDLRREHQPANTTEEILVNELADNYWRIRRMRRYETRIFASETAAEFAQKMTLLPLIQRGMTSAERAFQKALATLRQLQKERTKQTAPATHNSQDTNGFVSQNAPGQAASAPERRKMPLSPRLQSHANGEGAIQDGFDSKQIYRKAA